MRALALLALLALAAGCRKPPPPPPPATAADELEIAYLAATNLYGKLEALTDLEDAPAADAVVVLGRLFDAEEDPELGEEILHTLMELPGERAAKRQLLEEAIHPDRPLPVRLAAIDSLAELGDPHARPALQRLLADPNQQVRDAVDAALQDLP